MPFTMRKLRWPIVLNGIGCDCRKLKLSGIFDPKAITKSPHYRKFDNHLSWTNSLEGNDDENDSSRSGPTSISSHGKIPAKKSVLMEVGQSTVVVVDSDDPFQDFKQSMLQMIVEKEIYSFEGLQDLLHCFLSLNSPYHHQFIVRAFAEIWRWAFSGAPPATYSARIT